MKWSITVFVSQKITDTSFCLKLNILWYISKQIKGKIILYYCSLKESTGNSFIFSYLLFLVCKSDNFQER